MNCLNCLHHPHQLLQMYTRTRETQQSLCLKVLFLLLKVFHPFSEPKVPTPTHQVCTNCLLLLSLHDLIGYKMSWNNSSPTNQKKCNCGLPLSKLTSWTRDNPGRKFRACKFYDPVTESRGCKSFEWADIDDGTEWQRDVINQLLLDKKLMKGEINSLKREVDDLTGQRRCLLNEVDNLKLKCKALSGDRKYMMCSNGNSDSKLMFVVVVLCSVILVLGSVVILKLV